VGLAKNRNFVSAAGVCLIHQYWGWLLGAAVLAAVAIEYLLRRSARISASVAKELEEYLVPPQTTVATPGPLTPDSATVAERKQSIWDGIRGHPAPSNEVQIGWLVHRLAEAEVNVRFRNVYFAICGSQHRFLRELNQNSGTTTRPQAETFLRQLGEQNERIRAKGFTEWIGFMIEAGLLSQGVDTFTLTPIGQDFLVWTTRERLPDRIFEG
jgi:hypothetical protein